MTVIRNALKASLAGMLLAGLLSSPAAAQDNPWIPGMGVFAGVLFGVVEFLQARRRIALAAGAVPRVGRNDPCPCGSGKKYKQCHGKLT
jgi:uncharacterized protein YecA (UPF0149 family)